MSDNLITIAHVQFDEAVGSGRFPEERPRLTIRFASRPQEEANAIFRAFQSDRVVKSFESLWTSDNYNGIPARFGIDPTSGRMLFANFRNSADHPAALPTGNFDITFHEAGMDEFAPGHPKLEAERVYNPNGGPGVFRVHFNPTGQMVQLKFVQSLDPECRFDTIRLDETGHVVEPSSGYAREQAEQIVSRAKTFIGGPFEAPKLDDNTVVGILKALKEYGIRQSQINVNRPFDLGRAAAEIRGAEDPLTWYGVEDTIFRRVSLTYRQESRLSFVVQAGRLVDNFPGLAAAGVLNRAEFAYETAYRATRDRETEAVGLKHLIR